jgi:hypothetical protein
MIDADLRELLRPVDADAVAADEPGRRLHHRVQRLDHDREAERAPSGQSLLPVRAQPEGGTVEAAPRRRVEQGNPVERLGHLSVTGESGLGDTVEELAMPRDREESGVGTGHDESVAATRDHARESVHQRPGVRGRRRLAQPLAARA